MKYMLEYYEMYSNDSLHEDITLSHYIRLLQDKAEIDKITISGDGLYIHFKKDYECVRMSLVLQHPTLDSDWKQLAEILNIKS